MKFIYGKQYWSTMERGQENCYLLTNGLGGFSSASMIGSNTRSDHALFMASLQAPGHRYNMIHRLEEGIAWEVDTKPHMSSRHLSSQEYMDPGQSEKGYVYLSSFCFVDYPKWIYNVDGVEIVKEIAMKQGENLVAVKYSIDNQSKKTVILQVVPHMQFTPKGTGTQRSQEFRTGEGMITSNGMTVFFRTNGKVQHFAQQFTEGLYYAYDACDGRMCEGSTHTNHQIIQKVPGDTHMTLEILYSMKDIHTSADCVLQEAALYRKELVRVSGMQQEAAQILVKSADQFVAQRASTGGRTILAGFPFFEDWGRDTMIALAGCCITTKQFETAKSILRTFARYEKDGLMPNLFPEGCKEPQYNTADAALLYIHAAYLYIQRTKDLAFLEEIWPVMEEIVRCYKRGTAYGIRMEEDGLLSAGEKLDQVTWMDVRLGEILPTPRHGKPVEINAYWYNALCMMEEAARLLHRQKEYDYAAMAKRAKQSFRKKFWSEKNGCLKDVLSGTDADEQIRCNQIWAVSMPFAILDEEQEKQVVDTVFEKLYTPYGLRTLDPADPQFHGNYGGTQPERDMAYHQGTVWVFPLGAYYMAYLKTRHFSREAMDKVKSQLEVLESAMGEGCIAQLPEIYDGYNPSFSRGCFAQAWSVGEILRVYEALEFSSAKKEK